jgi:tetrahydromethanopterin S-methyltransferase subunit G
LAERGSISEKVFKQKMDQYQQDIDRLNRKLENINTELAQWGDNVGNLIAIIDNIKDFKEKYEVADNHTKNQMIKLMTKKIYAQAYLGENKRVNKNQTKHLDFVWSDAFQTLFESGIISIAEELRLKDNQMLPGKKSKKYLTTDKFVDFLFAIL